ncbi:flavin reductase family protein [Streptomyces roseoverticillatus]|uniref:flavin reductase family protein n=1 Tax=Streptomyces roseoverticillatus TaxID=66429 RepID=UPI001F19C8A6|nr:flavin reductase family protein [Streptomyces roseoverticillatus]MCF3103099.1 flavin reductase family protein [Streptomyces roseoverticillatus]
MTTESLLPARPAVSDDAFRHAMARLPTGVAVVTAQGPAGPVGCTVNAVMSLSLRPPALLVSLAGESRTLEQILDSGSFAVSVLSWDARHLARQFATGTAAQRFDGVSWQPQHGVPVLTAASVAAVCDVSSTAHMFDHTLVAGTVTWTRADERPPTVLYGNGQYKLGC